MNKFYIQWKPNKFPKATIETVFAKLNTLRRVKVLLHQWYSLKRKPNIKCELMLEQQVQKHNTWSKLTESLPYLFPVHAILNHWCFLSSKSCKQTWWSLHLFFIKDPAALSICRVVYRLLVTDAITYSCELLPPTKLNWDYRFTTQQLP